MCSSSGTRLVARAATNFAGFGTSVAALPDHDCRCAVPPLQLNLAALVLVWQFGRGLENLFFHDKALEYLYVSLLFWRFCVR